MTKLSIIVPVYNVEKYIQKCVNSIINQTYSNLEIILVDDGSYDGSSVICDEWAKRDSRISVIHKSNGGLSDARNAGLDVARGQYITFVDSDDWLLSNTLAPLIETIGDCDILEYSIEERLQLQDRIYDNIDEYWIRESVYTHTYAWNKIYRKELFENIRY